jgi:hypothetical protein
MWLEMKENGTTDGKTVERIETLDDIFENVISDASELIKDLYWGVKTYLFYGLIMILFGVQSIVYNIDSLQAQLYIPLFVAGALLFAGFAQVIHYFRLRKKYSRLFETQANLKKS